MGNKNKLLDFIIPEIIKNSSKDDVICELMAGTNCVSYALKNKRKLSYDFYIPNKDLLIEYNGKQHYINGFGSTTHEWHKQLHRDWLKRKYAKENGINLLVIPYTQFNNINKILEEKLV